MTDLEQPAKRNHGFRVSQLPATMRADAVALVKEFDADGDGCIDKDEFADAIKALKDSRSKTSQYGKIIAALAVSGILLIASIFGVSLVAARLSKDTTVSNFGVMLDKNSNLPVKTSSATEYQDEMNTGLRVIDMNPLQLMNLKQIVMFGGELFFEVKGHVRAPAGDKVIILVEGGTITYDGQGILDATGDARYMLDVAFGVVDIDATRDEEVVSIPEDGDRKLLTAFSLDYYAPSRDPLACRRRGLREEIGDARWRRLCGGPISSGSTSSSVNEPAPTITEPTITEPEPEPVQEVDPIFGFDLYTCEPTPIIGRGTYALC